MHTLYRVKTLLDSSVGSKLKQQHEKIGHHIPQLGSILAPSVPPNLDLLGIIQRNSQEWYIINGSLSRSGVVVCISRGAGTVLVDFSLRRGTSCRLCQNVIYEYVVHQAYVVMFYLFVRPMP